MKKQHYNSLFWKISCVFFLLLAIVGISHTYISYKYSQEYVEEVNQRLNHDTAKNIIDNSTPFYNGKIIVPALHEMFHHVMAINPSLEVYLVNPKGEILSWYPPEKKLQLTAINLKPVKLFIKDKTGRLIKGDDPLHPGTQKIFSAHPLKMNNMLYAYIYVVLNGEKQTLASDHLFSNYLLRVSYGTMGITLFFTFLIIHFLYESV